METFTSVVDVRLDIGCPLFSRITPAAKADPKLSAGQDVSALVKSVAISRGNSNGLDEKEWESGGIWGHNTNFLLTRELLSNGVVQWLFCRAS